MLIDSLAWSDYLRSVGGHPLSERRYQEGVDEVSVTTCRDGRNRHSLPAMAPYVAVGYHLNPDASPVKRQLAALRLNCQVASEWRADGVAGWISLPPEVWDARAWSWEGFEVRVRYTAKLELPYGLDAAMPDVRNKVRKFERGGGALSVESRDFSAILDILCETERRQGIDYRLSAFEKHISALVRSGQVRVYIAKDAAGVPRSTRIVLVDASSRLVGLDWMAGSTVAAFKSGGTQALIAFVPFGSQPSRACVLRFRGNEHAGCRCCKGEIGRVIDAILRSEGARSGRTYSPQSVRLAAPAAVVFGGRIFGASSAGKRCIQSIGH